MWFTVETMMNRQSRVIPFPHWSDPRWLVFFSLSLFASLLIQNQTFGKTFSQLLLAFFTVIVADFVINQIFLKKSYSFPLSALTSSTGVGLIVFSNFYWPFIVLPLLAVLSKRLIKYNGLHIFNPNNFGIVLGLLLMDSAISTTAGRWVDLPSLRTIVIIGGIYISYRVKRLTLSVAWLISFSGIALILSYWQNTSAIQALLPALDPLFYIFTFYHITDPITSPTNRWGSILFGFLLGAVDNTLRYFLVVNSMFFSLFIVTAVQPLFAETFKRDYLREYWVPNKK
jgi:enediyne biosynthesis protein E5